MISLLLRQFFHLSVRPSVRHSLLLVNYLAPALASDILKERGHDFRRELRVVSLALLGPRVNEALV